MKSCKFVLLNLFVFVLIIGLSGCASIVGDNQENISINSSPDKAEVKVKDQSGRVVQSGKTPMSVNLDTSAGYFDGEDYTLVFDKEGYQSRTLNVSATPSGWYIGGNLLFGGLIGYLIVDPATGSMWNLSPEEVNANLPESKVSMSENSMKIMKLKDVPNKLRDDMKLINES